MLLWDAESASWPELVNSLAEAARRRLALDVIELCFESFCPSFERLFKLSTVESARGALALLRSQVDAESLGVPEEEFFENLYAIQERDHSPGAASIVMAISECADSMRRELSGSDVLAIMSASYEALLNTQHIPRVTIQAERENENCVRLIARQRALLDEAVAHGSLDLVEANL
jgi:hypothetical protein